MNKYYYKVLNENLNSCWVSIIPQLNVKYKKNIWVYPKLKGTKLLVFDNLENANYFIDNMWDGDGLRIFKCNVKNPQIAESILDSFRVTLKALVDENETIIKKFWKGIITTNNRICIAPTGSIKCDAVKLIEEIK
jgi:hypothetical protein